MRGARGSVEVPDTIVARATPPGRGALAVLRLSGPGTRGILRKLGADRVFAMPPRTAVLCALRDEVGRPLDRGLVTFFQGPASFTGEDLAELSVHGGPAVVAAVLEACTMAGARPAEPGEFTRRAWIHGKLDRIQVEAVQDMVEAESPGLLRVAVAHLEGGLSRRLGALRSSLVSALAGIAHHLDFPDEDEAPTPVGALVEALASVRLGLEGLAETAPAGRLLREGAVVVLAGRPNAGKSSLFNALVGEDRVLVTPHPGTTRDAVDAALDLAGRPLRLVDTAGVRGREGTPDPVEAAGIEVSRRWIHRAQVVLWCRRGEEGPPDAWELEALEGLVSGASEAQGRLDPEDAGGTGPKLIPVRTCVDVEGDGGILEPWPPLGGRAWLELSASTGRGIDNLKEVLAEAAFGVAGTGGVDDEGHVLTRARHQRLVRQGLEEVVAAEQVLAKGWGAELAVLHLEEAARALTELVAPPDDDEVMDLVFSSFCIGK